MEGALCPTAAQLSKQFGQTNPFRHKKKGTKPTKKEGKNPQGRKAKVL
jgi:hypothetical protein